ncbi:MAG: chorismate synthase, partial [Armatimonadota bacterium]
GTEAAWEAVEASDLRCADAAAAAAMRARIDEAKAAGDSVGGMVEVVAEGVPPGLGSHVSWQERLDGRIGQAMLSIPAIKAVEIGDGFAAAQRPGSEVHDPILAREVAGWPFVRPTNHAGGIEGGISNGEPIVVRLAMKPIPTLRTPLSSVDVTSGRTVQAHAERSDVCAVPAAGVVAEAMLMLVLAGAAREKFGGDGIEDVLAACASYLQRLRLPWGGRRAGHDEV